MRLYRRQQFLQQYGISCNEHILISVGELNKNKNHETIIRAIAKLKNPAIHYFIAGQGGLREYLEHLAEELGVSKQVHLLGYRNDVVELLRIADVYVLPSHREGLNVSLMEAIASKTSVICSKIRGNTDLVKRKGYLFKASDVEHLAICIKNALENDNTSVEDEQYRNLKKYDSRNVGQIMWKLYGDMCG